MDVPKRLRRERLGLLIAALQKSGIEACLADMSAIDLADSPGIEAKIRLRMGAGAASPKREFGYEVVARVPSGGMAECFKVRDADGVLRFLKKVPVGGIQDAALRRELDIYAKLARADAAHVLQIVDQKEADDCIGLVMELADGGTLDEYREQQGELTPADAKSAALAILAGLRELHGLEIVHRDLKPANVLRAGDAWKLADFGTSKNLARLVTQGRTLQGHGTPGYTAPEQWSGHEAHPSADIYSFGKVLVFLFTGETDIDRLYDHPRWTELIRGCTQQEPGARLTLAQVEEALTQL